MTRTDFHRNLFYYYRGPVTSDHFASQQLENNTTKALINLLEHGGEKARSEFLRFLDVGSTDDHLEFALQAATIGERRIRGAKERLLLGIVLAERANRTASGGEATTGPSLPDAWIYNDDVVVLVESKLGATLDQDQHARHMALMGPSTRSAVRTWQGIHDLFLATVTNVPDLSHNERFLLQQFTKYLEYASMATTKTVDEELFDCLFHPEDDRGKSWVRETLRGLATSVKNALDPSDSLWVNVGNLQKQESGSYSCWVTLARSSRPSEEAHLAMELLPYELSISANVDTSTVQRLTEGLIRNPGALRRRLGALDGFYVSINHRKPIRPRLFEYVQVARLRCGDYIADDDCFNHISHLLQSLRAPGTYPSFSVTRTFNRHEVVELKDNLADTLVKEAQRLQPVVDFINSRGELAHDR